MMDTDIEYCTAIKETEEEEIRALLDVNLILLKLKEYLFCASPAMWQSWKEVRIKLAYVFSIKFRPRPSLAVQLVDIMMPDRSDCKEVVVSELSSYSLAAAAAAITKNPPLPPPLTGNACEYYATVDEYVTEWLTRIRRVVDAFCEQLKCTADPLTPLLQ